jgi:outer membrane protein TolC
MKRTILFNLLIFISLISLNAQSLSIDTCQAKAGRNYPLVKQFGLIEMTEKYNISNANKGYLPQLTLSGKATYQSDVTQIPASLGTVISQITGKPFAFPELTKDQYQAMLELNQVISDGGMISAQKKGIKASTEAESQKLAVDLYSLKERVNQVFFGILLINEQLVQNDILKSELQTNYDRIVKLKQNGVASQSDLDAIKVEQLNTQQREAELKTNRKTYMLILAAITGLHIDENTVLEKPVMPDTDAKVVNHRPELGLFDAQFKMYDSQKDAVFAGNLPKLGFFVQGGVGKPGLNMLTNSVSPFYVGGLRLSWNFSGFYSLKNNLVKIELNKKSVQVQKETFLFNNNLIDQQQHNEIDRLKEVLKNDDEIIGLRHNIKTAADVKVQNGTLTVTDLLREIDSESLAKQKKVLHEIQLYISIYQQRNTTNN